MNSAPQLIDLTQVPSETGILVYRVLRGADASGHIDLWNGNDCRVAIVNTIVNKTGISSKSAQPAQASDTIYQGGTEVGMVFGGRRSPTDAMIFEFVEITHSSRLDTRFPFEFNGVILRMVHAQSRVGMDSSRPEDGMVYSGVTAQVIGTVIPKD